MTKALDHSLLQSLPLPRLSAESDKEDRGAVLVVGGDPDMAGAAVLAGVAALKVGAGKLQIMGDEVNTPVLSVIVPEARIVCVRAGQSRAKSLAGAARLSSTVVIGPGMESRGRKRRLARRLLYRAPEATAVVDAGALPRPDEAAAFAALSLGRVVLTPHAGEMARMLDCDRGAVQNDSLACGREAARVYCAVVVMKGVTTWVATPDGTAWRHDGGVSGLGTSGSGDVLAGVIGGLLARGAPPATAALWGVALHAGAGVALARLGAPIGFLARELLDQLPLELARLDPASLRDT